MLCYSMCDALRSHLQVPFKTPRQKLKIYRNVESQYKSTDIDIYVPKQTLLVANRTLSKH
jgi:hypothetical protein